MNLASWLGNWELDVCVEDEAFAARLEAAFRRDLANATEIVLEPAAPRRRREGAPRIVEAPGPPPGGGSAGAPQAGGSPRSGHTPAAASRAAAAALTLGGRVGAALSQRPLGDGEARSLAGAGALLLALALLTLVWPRLLALPAAVAMAWLGAALLGRAHTIRRRARRGRGSRPRAPQRRP